MEKQFVASVYVIHNDQVLLIWHKKLQKWLPAGGHLEPNELPSDGAIREAFEETGYQIEIVDFDPLFIKQPNAVSIPRPYLCLLEEIPEFYITTAHQHIDFVFVGRLVGGSCRPLYEEIDGLRWFTMEEIEKLQSDIDIFEESKQVIRSIFHTIAKNPQISFGLVDLECMNL